MSIADGSRVLSLPNNIMDMLHITNREVSVLMRMNDKLDYRFNVIADYIEENLPQ